LAASDPARSLTIIAAELEKSGGNGRRPRRLCELNVMRQVKNVASAFFVQEAWCEPEPDGNGWILRWHGCEGS